jgi:hypothetical protein
MSGRSTLKFFSTSGPFIADGINEGPGHCVVGIEIGPKGFNGYRVSVRGGTAASGEANEWPPSRIELYRHS